MKAKGISSTDSTSISPSPTRYRPPAFTRGRCQSRTETVISPDNTADRSSRLNSTCSRYDDLWPSLKVAAVMASPAKSPSETQVDRPEKLSGHRVYQR